MKKVIIFLIAILPLYVLAQDTVKTNLKKVKTFVLQEGDILFQDLDCGDFCDAVETVTKGVKGARFSHVALAVKNENGEMAVIEAISKGVSITPLDTFLHRSSDRKGNPKVIVGRMIKKYEHLIAPAVKEAFSLVGKPYDVVFKLNNDDYYCSELIHEVYKRANNGKAVFVTYPMTFKDPKTNQTFDAWYYYFRDLKQPVPEGELGNSPGSISYSNKIEIVHAYGIPSGWSPATAREVVVEDED